MSYRLSGRRRLWMTAVVLTTLALSSTLPGVAAPSAADYVNQAIALYNKGNCTKAVEILKKAIVIDPRYAPAYSWLGLCYVELRRNQEALAAFKKVVELAPNSEYARIARQWITRLQQQASPASPRPAAKPASPAPLSPTYLVDMPAATGVTGGNRPREVQLFGEMYRKAITERRLWYENPEWKVVYNLQRKFIRFRALAGVADESPPEFTATFEVEADGKVLYKSPPKRVGDVPENLDLDVTGVLQLVLVVRDEKRSYLNVSVVWADPRVYPRGAVIPPRPTPSAVGQLPATPANTPSLARSPSPVLPAAQPTTASRTPVLVMPFADSSGTNRDAGAHVTTAIVEELFKLGRVETISQRRVSEVIGYGRYDALDVGFARQAAHKLGAGVVVLGIVERFHVTSSVSELIIRIYYKDVFVVVSSFQVVDAATGERLLSDSARVALRSTAAEANRLPSDDEMLREATRRVAVQIAQRIGLVWARRTGELTIQVNEAVLASNVTRDADFRLRASGVSTRFVSSALQIVVYVSATGAKPGQRIEFVWYGPNRQEYARGTVVVPQDHPANQPLDAHHVIRPQPGGSFATGNWTVEIRVEGYLLMTLSFSVFEA